MSYKTNKKLIKKYILDIGTFFFYENFIISEINEGISMNFDKATKLFSIGKKHYGNHIPFVYISNRINSYSFEPTSHFKSVELFSNLKGFAVVTYDPINSKIAGLEQAFINVPTKLFDNVDDAINWVNELIIPD